MFWWIVLGVLAVGVAAFWACVFWINANQTDPYRRGEDRCVMCGAPVPEGMMVCPNCEKDVMEHGRIT